jgi:hypothetical protein
VIEFRARAGHPGKGILAGVLLVLGALGGLGMAESGKPREPFAFYAVYQRIASAQSLDLREIHHSVMSRDGEKLLVYGRSATTGQIVVYTLDSDGTNAQEVSLPSELNGIADAAINGDGSLGFLRHQWANAIYRVEGGKAKKMFDADHYGQVGRCDQIQTTEDGEWVYFLDGRRGIWRVRQSGGAPQRLIVDTDVPRDGGKGANIGIFRISADGQTVAFVVNGYWDDRGVFHDKYEVFALTGGRTRQLTKDRGNIYKMKLAISGDGRLVAYSADKPAYKWRIVRTDGGGAADLAELWNPSGVVVNFDGSKVFYSDERSNFGKLINSDGSGGVDLFPRYNVSAIPLHAIWSHAISEGGERISFRFDDGIFVGHLGAGAHAVANAPVIHEVWFEPPVQLPSEAAVGTTLRARITDPDGLEDLVRTSTNELVDGWSARGKEKVPVYFYHAMNDVGHPPDASAQDGVFSSGGSPGGEPDAIPRTRIRVAVMDRSGTVVVADAGLSGGAEVSLARKGEDLAPDEEGRTGEGDGHEEDMTLGEGEGAGQGSAGSSPWAPATTSYDPACESGCVEKGVASGCHEPISDLLVDPKVDDAIAQWGDCLQSMADCIEEKRKVVPQCVSESACPESCRSEFASRAGGETDSWKLLGILEGVFVVDGAMCRPVESEVQP